MKSLTVRDGVVASIWAALGVIGARGLAYVGGLALARFVGPEAFGVMGMALVATSSMVIVQDLGVGKALLRAPGDEEPAASTALWIVLLLGAALTTATWAEAERIAAFLGGGADVVRALRLVAPLPILGATAIVPTVLLERRLDFRRRAWTEWAPAGAAAVSGVVAAVLVRDLTALAIYHLAVASTAAVVAFGVARFRPSLRFDGRAALALLHFGKWVTAASLTAFVFFNLDRFLVGRFIGSEALGFYLLALGFGNLPAVFLTSVAGRVSLPAYAQLQREGRGLAHAHLHTLALLAWIAVPAAGLLGWFGPRVIAPVFGRAWIEAGSILPILAVYGLFRSLAGPAAAVLLTRDRTPLFLAINLVQLAPAALFLVAPPADAAEVARVFTAGMMLGAASALALSFRAIGVSQRAGWSALAPAAAAGAGAAALFAIATRFGLTANPGGGIATMAAILLLYGATFFLAGAERLVFVPLRELLPSPRRAR